MFLFALSTAPACWLPACWCAPVYRLHKYPRIERLRGRPHAVYDGCRTRFVLVGGSDTVCLYQESSRRARKTFIRPGTYLVATRVFS